MTPGPKRQKTKSTAKPVLNTQPIASLPELDLFSFDQLQVQVQEIIDETLLPTGVLQENSEIVFNIRGDLVHFIDPRSIKLKVTVEVRNGDGSALQAAANIAPIANLAGALFSKVAVVVGNSTPITSTNTLYPYLSYLENVFRSSKAYKEQFDYISLIYRDTAASMDFATALNPGFENRKTQCAGSEPIKMLVDVVSPLTTQNRLLIPMVDLSFYLQPATAQFLIRSDVAEAQRNQKVVITSISMLYSKLRLNTDLHLSIMNSIARSPAGAVYPVKFLKTIEIAKQPGVTTIRETLFTDRLLPSNIFLFCVSTQRRLGTYETTPYLIWIGDIDEIKVVSGSTTHPSIPYKPEIRHMHELYMTTQRCLGAFEPGKDNGILMSDFFGGYGLITFDPSRTGHPEAFSDVPRLGDLQLHVDMHAPGLTQQTTFILVLEYYKNLFIRNNLEITTEFIP